MNNPKNRHKTYIDEFTGIEASVSSKIMAWGLIAMNVIGVEYRYHYWMT